MNKLFYVVVVFFTFLLISDLQAKGSMITGGGPSFGELDKAREENLRIMKITLIIGFSTMVGLFIWVIYECIKFVKSNNSSNTNQKGYKDWSDYSI